MTVLGNDMSQSERNSVLFSAMQPTGTLHLGNYIGALKNWVSLQSSYKSFFAVVDMHAITVENNNPSGLSPNSTKTIAMYIACGIDPQKSIIFKQSNVAAHAELCWILMCHTMLGKLNRMTQFKEKSSSFRSSAPVGLLCYPVLMAADILLYNSKYVPVGDDQIQHIELTRDIASAFNEKYGKELFTLPEPLLQKNCSRIMSLKDGTKKMSKSDSSEYSRIELTDTDDDIASKIRKAKTDSISGFNDLQSRPEINNLVGIYSELSNEPIDSICSQFASLGTLKFKEALSELLISSISPIRSAYNSLIEDVSYLDKIQKDGAELASIEAVKTLDAVKRAIGFRLYS